MTECAPTSRTVYRRINKPLLLLLCLAISFLAFSGYLSLQNSRQIVAAQEEVLLRHKQKDLQVMLLARLSAMESAMFGFIITGQERFLSDYLLNTNEVRRLTAALRDVSLPNAELVKKSDAVSALVQRRIELSRHRVEMRREQGLDAASALIATGEAKSVMDQIQSVLLDWLDEGERLLVLKQEKLAAGTRRNLALNLLLGTSSVVILATICWLLLVENARRKENEDALRAARSELEDRVRARTSELAATNNALSERIAAQEQAERALRESESELAAKNRDLELLIYIISHDLRAPLVNVLGFAKELSRATEDIIARLDQPDLAGAKRFTQAIEDSKEAISFITSAAHRMDGLVNGILKYSRLGRQALSPEKISMRALMDELQASLAFQLKTQNASVTVGELPDCVADRTQVEQLFGNLLDNALKYRRAERAPEIRVEGERRNGECIYRVIDNGIGIPSHQREKVFHIFHRVGESQSPGEGLGLTICQRIVERHRGRIWIEEGLHGGTAVNVALPHAS